MVVRTYNFWTTTDRRNPSTGYLRQVAKRFLPPVTRLVKEPTFDVHRTMSMTEAQISWEWSDV